MRDFESIQVVLTKTFFLLPLFSCTLPAGFLYPATDHLEDEFLDLNRLLPRHSEATYLVRVAGEGMAGAEIHTGDLLVVDDKTEADHEHIVVAVVEGECTVKQYDILLHIALLYCTKGS